MDRFARNWPRLATTDLSCIYNYTLSKLNLKPEECIAIEDSTYGIQAAKGAGITTFAKRDDRFHFEQDMADVVIDDLLQIIRFFKI